MTIGVMKKAATDARAGPEQKAGAQVGAVMVAGGGIAGIQAALDLAESGFKVYLVESSPAIGGNMARLDKAFPTNDCSMCILSPKLVDAARNLNIELLTMSEAAGISGVAGDFTVRVSEQARYVDASKCTGCGSCLEKCPTRNLLRVKTPRPPAAIDARNKVLADELLAEHGREERSLIRVMQEINARLTYLPRDVMVYIAAQAGIPLSRLHRIGTFYKAFSFEPRGRHTISVCAGTACHIRGAPRIMSELKRELNTDEGRTTADGRFYIESVRCLGCCSLAPVLKIDDRIYGGVKTSEVAKILKDHS